MICEAAFSVLLTVGSVHLVDGDFNEFNYGVGIEAPVSECLTVNGGYYRNSYDENTFYVSAATHWKISENWKWGLEFGAGTGYQKNGHPFMGGATLSYKRVKILAAPEVVGLQLRIW